MIPESKIDAAIERMFAQIEFAKEPEGLYDPLKYMIEIGGKRIRPKLCLTAFSLFADELTPDIAQPATAIEVFHSFTLMHDDIMDRSPLRRGRPTVWKKWNEDTAILSGDAMLIEAYRRISATPQPAHGEVLALFTKTAAQVCEGQQLDMEFEGRESVSMVEYEQMIGLKTAVLLACSAKIGAVLGGATPGQADALYRYAYLLGMAFQICDDYLDAFGDEKVFGKPIGGDILNCKKTWLTICAAAKNADFPRLLAAEAPSDSEKTAKIQNIKQIYINSGVDKDAREAVRNYSDKAMGAIEGIGLSAVKEEALRRFAENLVGRAK